jgi:hypothetical protein
MNAPNTITQLVAAPRVGPHPSQLGRLGDTDVTFQQGVTDARMVVHHAGLAGQLPPEDPVRLFRLWAQTLARSPQEPS